MAKSIKFIIKKDGTTEIDLEGYQGKECEGITEKLVKALGKEVKAELKDEYFKQDSCTNNEQTRM